VGGLLTRDGRHQVEYAVDGSDALMKLRESHPELVVTDLQMPNRSGLELVSAIRLHHSNVPVILTTGHGSEALAVEALARGAAGYVPKTHLTDRLLETVDEVLTLTRADKSYERLISRMVHTGFSFDLDPDPHLIDSLVDLVQQMVAGMNLTDDTGRYRVGVAVKEALLNAMFRGNLEIRYDQAPDVRGILLEGEMPSLVHDRLHLEPYSARQVHVEIDIQPEQATIVVRDEGPGFDHAGFNVESNKLDGACGKGLLLMRSFMDVVRFNEKGNEVTLIKRRETNA
jgi:CheY-like chemotaxis protein/anti-sigma regulatory factor (Ser/Thr protein kinase)